MKHPLEPSFVHDRVVLNKRKYSELLYEADRAAALQRRIDELEDENAQLRLCIKVIRDE